MIFVLFPFFGTFWIIVSILLGVILLFLLGIFYDKNDDDGFIVFKAFAVIVACAFWPFITLIAVCIGVVAIPIYLGKKTRNFITLRKEKKIEKENFFKQLEESNKKGG